MDNKAVLELLLAEIKRKQEILKSLEDIVTASLNIHSLVSIDDSVKRLNDIGFDVSSNDIPKLIETIALYLGGIK